MTPVSLKVGRVSLALKDKNVQWLLFPLGTAAEKGAAGGVRTLPSCALNPGG